MFLQMASMRSTLFFLLVFQGQPGITAVRRHSVDENVAITIRAYWIRHGVSCSNILREFTNVPGLGRSTLAGMSTQHSVKDPSLTDCAVQHAQEMGQQIKSKIVDDNKGWFDNGGAWFVFSSTLVRAMETASYNFPEAVVRPIPYISEKGTEDDNTALPWQISPVKCEATVDNVHKGCDQQIRLSAKVYGNSTTPKNAIKRIQFKPSINPVNHTDRDTFSYEAFQQRFPELLSKLLPKESYSNGSVIPVVIVSHSGYMKDNVRCAKRKPRNNEVWVKEYAAAFAKSEKSTKAKLPAMTASASCSAPLFDETSFPKYVGSKREKTNPDRLSKNSYPCESDIGRCLNSYMSYSPKTASKQACCPSAQLRPPQEINEDESSEQAPTGWKIPKIPKNLDKFKLWKNNLGKKSK